MANNNNGTWQDAYGDDIPDNGVDLFLSIHCNSNAGTPGNGTEILYYNHPGSVYDLGPKAYQFGSVELGLYIDDTKYRSISEYQRRVG